MSDQSQRQRVKFTRVQPLAEFQPRGAPLPAVILTGLLILNVALAPLPLGSARPLPWSILAVAAALSLLVASWQEALDPSPKALLRPLLAPLLLGLLVFAWIAFQTLPSALALPSEPIWSMAEKALGIALSPSISIDRSQTATDLLHLLTYAAIFLAAWRVSRDSKTAWLVVRALGWIGTGYALYGLVVYSLGNHSILWLTKWAYRDDLTGTFVNRNNFATFLGLTLLCNLVSLIELFEHGIDATTRRTKILSLVDMVLSRGRWVVARLIVVAGALLLTHSRGGTIATAFAVIVLSLLVLRAPGFRGAWRMPLLVTTLVGMAIVGVAGGAGVLTRFANDSFSADARNDVYVGTVQAIRDHSLLGTGLGSFQFVYPAYQSPNVSAFFDLAHDDYHENALELGLPAAVAFYLMLALLSIECAIGVVRRRRHMVYPGLAVAASTLVGVHALIDFSLQVPAVAVLYAALLGIGVAQSRSTAQRRDSSLRLSEDQVAPVSR